jgi:hypothetical protein
MDFILYALSEEYKTELAEDVAAMLGKVESMQHLRIRIRSDTSGGGFLFKMLENGKDLETGKS